MLLQSGGSLGERLTRLLELRDARQQRALGQKSLGVRRQRLQPSCDELLQDLGGFDSNPLAVQRIYQQLHALVKLVLVHLQDASVSEANKPQQAGTRALVMPIQYVGSQ